MFPIQVIALLIGFLLLSLLLAYGRTRWFGKKFHWVVFIANVLENLSFMSAILLFGWQTISLWRPCLLVIAGLTWLFALVWLRRLQQAQKQISGEASQHHLRRME